MVVRGCWQRATVFRVGETPDVGISEADVNDEWGIFINYSVVICIDQRHAQYFDGIQRCFCSRLF